MAGEVARLSLGRAGQGWPGTPAPHIPKGRRETDKHWAVPVQEVPSRRKRDREGNQEDISELGELSVPSGTVGGPMPSTPKVTEWRGQQAGEQATRD